MSLVRSDKTDELKTCHQRQGSASKGLPCSWFGPSLSVTLYSVFLKFNYTQQDSHSDAEFYGMHLIPIQPNKIENISVILSRDSSTSDHRYMEYVCCLLWGSAVCIIGWLTVPWPLALTCQEHEHQVSRNVAITFPYGGPKAQLKTTAIEWFFSALSEVTALYSLACF